MIRTIPSTFIEFARELRLASRTLLKSPGFFLAATACLSLGIGATAAMYSQIQATVFGRVPGVARPDELVRLQQPISYTEFEQLGAYFDQRAAVIGPVPFLVDSGAERTARTWGQLVSPRYFDVLGVRPFLGQTFTAVSETFDSARECVISHRLCKTRFGGSERVIGQTLTLNSQRLTIAGVTPAGFLGSSPATSSSDIWIPLTAHPSIAPELRDLRNPQTRTVMLLGRLAPTMNREAAEHALDAALRRYRASQISKTAATNEKLAILLPAGNRFPVRPEELPRAIGFPLVLAGLVLLMACGNVSHLVLARLLGRQRELAVRISLGASSAQVLRTCLAETTILTVAGATGGLALAIWFLSFVRWLSRYMPGYVHLDAELDWTSLCTAVSLGAAASVASGLLPAIRAIRLDPHHSLKSRSSSAPARGWLNFQNVVVFQQVVTSMVLLLLTGFVVFGWYRAAGRDLGYDPHGAYLIKVDPVRSGLTPDESGPLVQRIAQRLRAEAWINNASVAYSVPVAMSSGDLMVAAKVDFAAGAKALPTVRIDHVGEGFFRNLGVRILQGREFTASDERPSSRVVIVNQALAKRTWPDGRAVGQTLQLENETWEVVGVTNDIRSAFLLSPDLPVIYQPIHSKALVAASRHGVALLVRTFVQGDVAARVSLLLESMDKVERATAKDWHDAHGLAVTRAGITGIGKSLGRTSTRLIPLSA